MKWQWLCSCGFNGAWLSFEESVAEGEAHGQQEGHDWTVAAASESEAGQVPVDCWRCQGDLRGLRGLRQCSCPPEAKGGGE